MFIRLLKNKLNEFKEKKLIFDTQDDPEENKPDDIETTTETQKKETTEGIKKAGEETGSELIKAIKPFQEIAETIAKPLIEGKEAIIKLGKNKNTKEFQENADSYYKEVSKKLSPEELKKYDDLREKATQVSIAELQGGYEWLGVKEENYDKKYTEISKAYLDDLGDGSFKVKSELDDDETVKFNLGAGDILPPSITMAAITDLEGNTRIGKRMTINEHTNERIIERTGYYDKHGYIPIYGNYIIRPTESISETSNEYKSAVNSEKENYKAVYEQEKSQSSTADLYDYESLDAIYADPNLKEAEGPITVEKINLANQLSQNATKIENFDDLSIKNKPLSELIRHVSKHFGVPEPLMYATFKTESNFRNSAVGDYHTKLRSIGIGQFQDGTYKDNSDKPEFKSFMSKYYPNQNFERGENILADITVTAIKLKNDAESYNIDLKKPLSDKAILTLRGKYTGAIRSKEYKQRMNDGTIADYNEGPRYANFLKLVRKFEHQYVGTKIAESSSNTDLSNIDIEYKDLDKNSTLPIHYKKVQNGLARSGAPGFLGSKGEWNENDAKRQLKGLKEQKIETLVFLAPENKPNKTIAENMGFKVVEAYSNDDNFSQAINESKKLANTSNICAICRHGNHRVGGFSIARSIFQGAKSMYEAFKSAGQELSDYNKWGKGILKTLIKLAEEKNLQIDQEFYTQANIRKP